jgi:hypothetical protein
MNSMRRGVVGLVVGLGLSLSLALPAFAEPGGKAGVVLDRIDAQITYQTLVLQVTKNELIAYGAAVRANNPNP